MPPARLTMTQSRSAGLRGLRARTWLRIAHAYNWQQALRTVRFSAPGSQLWSPRAVAPRLNATISHDPRPAAVADYNRAEASARAQRRTSTARVAKLASARICRCRSRDPAHHAVIHVPITGTAALSSRRERAASTAGNTTTAEIKHVISPSTATTPNRNKAWFLASSSEP